MRFIISTIALETEQDIFRIRRMVRRIAELLGFDDFARNLITTAVSSVAGRSFALAAGSTVEFGVGFRMETTGGMEAIGAQTMTVRVGYPHITHDFEAERQLVDGLEMENGPRPALRLEKRLPDGAPRITDDSLSRIASSLPAEPAASLLEELRWQDRQWMRARAQLAQVTQELEDTNAGVMALYTELDGLAQQLRHASEMKSRFLSHLSHEVRTPVNSINALSAILLRRLDGGLTAEQEKQLTFIREAAQQLSNLVKDELDMAKVEAGKISVHVGDFQIGQVFGALRGMFKPLMQNPDVSLIFDEPGDIPMLRSDEGKVAQILRNLISNALKFTPNGEIRVSAHLQADRRSVELTVADTGIGIAAVDQQRIFKEFFQVDGAAPHSRDGAGIGLHLSRQLAELLGGSLIVTSEPQVGSVFTATLPLFCPQAGVKQADRGGSCAPILVIDDDGLSRYVLKQIIGDLDFQVLEAESGAEGLSLARSEKPRLIFLDLVMAGLSGYQVLRELKNDAATREIPVVILTSLPEQAVRLAELEGAAAVIFKDGLSREALLGLIQQCEESSKAGIGTC